MYSYEILLFIDVPAGSTPAEVVERMNSNNLKANLLYVAGSTAFIIVSFTVDFIAEVEDEFYRVEFFFYVAFNINLKVTQWEVLTVTEVIDQSQVLFIARTYISPDSYKYYDNIILPEDTAGGLIERELNLNFDFLEVGKIDTNIIYINPEIVAVLCSYKIDNHTAEAIENQEHFLTGATLNIDAVLNLITIEWI